MVADVATDPRWVAFSELGDKLASRACWSEPIVDSKGVVLGTFALYRKEAGVPDEDEIALIDAMGHIVGIAMERKKYRTSWPVLMRNGCKPWMSLVMLSS